MWIQCGHTKYSMCCIRPTKLLEFLLRQTKGQPKQKKKNEEMKKRNSEAEGKERALENDNIYETSTHEDIIQPFK